MTVSEGEVRREIMENPQSYSQEEGHKVGKNHGVFQIFARIFSPFLVQEGRGKGDFGKAGKIKGRAVNPWLKPGIFLVAGVFLMCLSGVLSGSGERGVVGEPQVQTDLTDSAKESSYRETEGQIEAKLERIISQVAGVGQVFVSVTLDRGMTTDYATDVSTVEKQQQETDADGVQRSLAEQTSQRQLVLEKGGASPIVISRSMPSVRGVAVVATGVECADVRENVFQIVRGLLDVPAHKIIITNGKE